MTKILKNFLVSELILILFHGLLGWEGKKWSSKDRMAGVMLAKLA